MKASRWIGRLVLVCVASSLGGSPAHAAPAWTGEAQPAALGAARDALQQAAAERTAGRPAEAIEFLRRGRSLLEPLNEPELLADVCLDLGTLLQTRGDIAGAVEALSCAVTINEQLGRQQPLEQSYRARGGAFDRQGRRREAIDDYTRMRALAVGLGDRPGVAVALTQLGRLHQALGELGPARAFSEEGLSAASAVGDSASVAIATNALGIVNEVEGNYRAALQSYLRSLEVRRATGNKANIARVLLNIGNVYSAQGNYPLALEQYRESQKLAAEAGDRSLEAVTFITTGNAYGRAGDYTRAIEYLTKSLEISRAGADEAGVAYATLNIAEAYRLLGRFTEAEPFYTESLALVDKLGEPGLQAATILSFGKLLDDQGKAARCLEMAERAQTLARDAGERETLWQAQTMAGVALRKLGETTKAVASFDRAIAIIEEMRGNVAGGEEEAERSFESQVAPYVEMAELLVASGRQAEALTYAERAKGRVLLDVLHSGRVPVTKAMTSAEQDRERALSAELVRLNREVVRGPAAGGDRAGAGARQEALLKARRDYEAFQAGLYGAHPELKTIRGEASVLSLADTAELIPDSQTALLEYLVTDRRTFLFVVTRGGDGRPTLAVFTIEVERKVLADLAERFRQQLATRDLVFRQSAQSLHRLLVQPAQALLTGKNNLIVVPETVLWNVPFQALQTSTNRYLVEDFAFSYAPSLTVLREMGRGRVGRPTVAPSLLAVGNPALTASGSRALAPGQASLEPLPDAERQATALAHLYKPARTEVLVGRSAREERVKQLAGEYQVLHLATHGVFDNASPMHSYVVLSQVDPGAEDGLLEAREIMNLDLRADLVVLSACETARGRADAGEGVIGLTWAFFVAGSPTTVVSQWSVDSLSTTELMLAFHRARLGKATGAPRPRSTAQSMRAAALSLLNGANYAHPFYWAGFVVVGDGR